MSEQYKIEEAKFFSALQSDFGPDTIDVRQLALFMAGYFIEQIVELKEEIAKLKVK